MKIKTQFRLLIAGILIVPLLLIAFGSVYWNIVENGAAVTAYEDITALLDDEMTVKDRERFSYFMYRMSKIGGITIFRKDFQVVHSTISAFIPGETVPLEKVFSFVNQQDSQYARAFETIGWRENHGYILIQRDLSLSPKNYFAPPDTAIPLIALFLFPIIFAITMSLIIARSITNSILVLEDATRRIAGGELDLKVDAKGSNEITSLTNSLNKMRGVLKEEEQRRYRFIMGITHDLKTPLASIKGYAEAIEDGVAGDDDERRAAVEIISGKADQLEGMINDLLDFVRMDSVEWRSRLEMVDITAFLQDFAAGIVSDVELFRHRMEVSIQLDGFAAAPLDERLFQRALENLIGNAIRYTPDDTLIKLDAVFAGNAAAISISDSGPGIAPEDLPHVFELFYRGTSSRREQGMGLGLAVVKWVADSHGWQLSAQSEPGRGTCFTITIPLGI